MERSLILGLVRNLIITSTCYPGMFALLRYVNNELPSRYSSSHTIPIFSSGIPGLELAASITTSFSAILQPSSPVPALLIGGLW